jgi:hypothetical protein
MASLLRDRKKWFQQATYIVQGYNSTFLILQHREQGGGGGLSLK